MKKILGIFGIILCITGCSSTEKPLENQVFKEITVTPESKVTENILNEDYIYFSIIDNITLQECASISIPKNYKIQKAKIVDELKTGRFLVCAVDKLKEDTIGFYEKVDSLEDSMNCTALHLYTSSDFEFIVEASNKTYDNFIWRSDGEINPGECVTENSITLEKITDNSGWYQNSQGFHIVITFDCGSLRFSAEDLEKLKEVVSIMVK